MNEVVSPDDAPRRIWTDPFFFAILGAIAASYVLLIIAMLGADTLYLFKDHPEIPVKIDFELTSEGKRLGTGDLVTDVFQKYGLSIGTEDPDQVTPRILNSSHVPFRYASVGSPHADWGGSGLGEGGQRTASTQNERPLANILVISQGELGRLYYECRFDFEFPVGVQELVWPKPLLQPVRVTGVDGQGVILWNKTVDPGEQTMQLEQPNVQRLVVGSHGDFGTATLSYQLEEEVQIDLAEIAPRQLSQLSTRVADPSASQIELAQNMAAVRLRWDDAVTLDQLTLLNLTGPGNVTLYGDNGEKIADERIQATDANGVRVVVLEHSGVQEAKIDIPVGGGLAAVDFRWSGYVRSDWEREHEGLTKWTHNPLVSALKKPEIRYSIKLSLISCTITTILSLWVAVPVGYLLSRYRFPFHNLVDAILDIPIVLPPLVVGLSLLILFQFFPRELRERVVYEIPAVILAQFAVACAFAVRSMRASFDQIDRRRESVALTLGCSRAQAFFRVVMPEAGRGMVTAGTLAWARSLGEFGPLLVFAGATRMKTEVLSTTVFLELSVGDLSAAVAVSLIMVASAIVVLVLTRIWGSRAFSV